jgi:elongation factor 3
MTHQGKTAVVEDAFADAKSPKGSGANTPARSRLQTPIGSTNGTPAGSGVEEMDGLGKGSMVKKKKKLTRNQMKAQEERRRLRKLHWLQFGGPKPEDTESDREP